MIGEALLLDVDVLIRYRVDFLKVSFSPHNFPYFFLSCKGIESLRKMQLLSLVLWQNTKLAKSCRQKTDHQITTMFFVVIIRDNIGYLYKYVQLKQGWIWQHVSFYDLKFDKNNNMLLDCLNIVYFISTDFVLISCTFFRCLSFDI